MILFKIFNILIAYLNILKFNAFIPYYDFGKSFMKSDEIIIENEFIQFFLKL